MHVLLTRCLRSALNAVAAYGRLWVYVPPVPVPSVPTAGPPSGHPERLCPEVPLSDLEKELSRQLLGVPDASSHGS